MPEFPDLGLEINGCEALTFGGGDSSGFYLARHILVQRRRKQSVPMGIFRQGVNINAVCSFIVFKTESVR